VHETQAQTLSTSTHSLHEHKWFLAEVKEARALDTQYLKGRTLREVMRKGEW